MHGLSFALHAALVNAIHVVRSRQDVAHVKTELLKRLRKASDWLVSAFLACGTLADSEALGLYQLMCFYRQLSTV